VSALWTLQAQSYEIRVLERGAKAYVQLRNVTENPPQVGEKFTDLMFGVMWTNKDIKKLEVTSSLYGIVASGTPMEINGVYHQSFGAMGMPRFVMKDWKQGEWVDVAVLNAVGAPGWGFYFEKQLSMSPYQTDLRLDANVGYMLHDESPKLVDYNYHFRLTGFDAAEHEPFTAMVQWSADEHELLDHYIVERSLNGKDWHEVGYISRDRENPQYEYLDTKLDGVRNGVFYRLRIEDSFGGYTYSDKDFVPFQTSVTLYPNPAVDGLYVEIDKKGIVKPDQMVVYDVNGRLLHKQEIPAGSYQEYLDFSRAGLQEGFYILEMRTDNEIYWNEKFEVITR
ncbi:MAG: T9SS type A sorting domain-containing protein, partial [Saprospiraceae bacterium]|nr:T9SS type A sorting domain-containing protein [Saprospiraceae bacterium]